MCPDSRAVGRSAFLSHTHPAFRLTRNATKTAMAALLCVLGTGSGMVLTSQNVIAAQPTDCPTVLLGKDGNICTANDVEVAAAVSGLGGQTAHCMPGEEYVVNLEGSLVIRNNDRWDIGIFIANDGKDLTLNAGSGGAASCEVAPLPAIPRQRDNPADPNEDPVVGAFDDDGLFDQCGDTSGLSPLNSVSGFPITTNGGTFDGPVTLTCVAGPSGKLELQSLVSWNQKDQGYCDPTDPDDYYLTQISKCSVNSSPLNVEVVGSVTIRKTAQNGGINNFGFTYSNTNEPTADTITNPPSSFDLQDGGEVVIYAEIGTGPATVVVDETNLPANWQLASLSCTGDDATSVTINGSEVTIPLSYNTDDPDASQSDVVCTYVNEEVIPEVTLVKSTTTADFDSTDDSIVYSYLVSNTGNVVLNFPVSVSDDKVTVTCPDNDGDLLLEPGESVTCSASYDVGQPDIDAGFVTNTADATVDGVTSDPVSVTVNAVQTPAMTVSKTSPTTSITSPLTVSYSYLVTNTGNVTLTTIALSDDNDDNDLSCPSDTLAPMGQMTCTASRAVSQVEIDAGGNLVNNVSATSTEGATAQNSLSIPITQSPSLLVLKDGTWNDDGSITGVAEVGETIDYAIFVQNNGNVTLTSISVTDPLITGTISCDGGANPIASLAPNASDTCRATYTITAGDVTAGSRANTATATSGATSSTGSDTVDLPDAPGLTMVKAGVFQDENPDGYAAAGETILYTFDVTNNGVNPATQVDVSDPLITGSPNLGSISCTSGSNPIASLAGGATERCTATYTLTQADVDLGLVYNLATADGDNTEPTTADNTETLVQFVDWTFTKTGVFQDESDDSLAQPGETILYTFAVANTGLVTLTNVAVTDPKIAIINCTGGNPIPAVAPATTVECTGSYAVTQVDIDAGQVENTGTGNPDESTATDSSETTSLPREAGMTIVKSSATTEVVAPVTVLYSYLVTNTGNVTLTGISLDDDNDEDDMSCPSTSLNPGTDMTCSASHIVTQEEIDANGSPTADSGLLQNSVSGSATELSEGPSTSLDIAIVQNSGMEVQKSSTTAEVTSEGVVSYDYLVTNTGNVTLTGLILTDNNVDAAVDCGGVDTVAPGDDLTCSAVHTVTQQELEQDGSPEPGSGVLYNDVVAASNDAEDATDNLSIPLNYYTDVTFRVTKYFSDDNPAEVTVQLTCNAGLPLQQTFKLADTEHVTFSVKQFEPGEMDCWVEEIANPADGYDPTYVAAAPDGEAGAIRSEEDGCYFDGVVGGEFTCDITNAPADFTYEVTKVWDMMEAEDIMPDGMPAEVLVECRNVLVQGSLQTTNETFMFYSPDEATESYSPGAINQPDDDDETDDVTACRAIEVNVDSTAFLSDQGCAADTLYLPGSDTTQGCTITNILFFEGIPTMSRFGLAVMALLMLAVGMVTMRRFGG